jgi:hypothetical protein
MNMPRVFARQRLTALLLCVPLAACNASASDAPGADDIKAAVNDYFNHFFGAWSPLNNHVRVQEVKNLSCTAANGQPGYVCKFDMVELAPPKPDPVENAGAHGRFVKDGDKWTYNKD